MLLLIVITFLFIIYSSSEALANIARHAGAKTRLFPLGLMLSNQIYSLNRFNGFMIAPLLGLYVDTGGEEGALKFAAVFGCAISSVLLLLVLKAWPLFLLIFSNFLTNLRASGFSLGTVRRLLGNRSDFDYNFQSRQVDFWLMFSQSLCTSLALPSAFVLNILAIRYPEYRATLVQSATVVSGVGNLILNFYISPRIAFAETRGASDAEYYSAMIGKIVGIGIIATCTIAIL